MVVPMTMTSHGQQQQPRTPAQQSPYAAGWTPQQRPVSPLSSYDARSFSRQGDGMTRLSPTSPQRSSQQTTSPTSPTRMPPPLGQTPSRGILSQRRVTTGQMNSTRTNRTQNDSGRQNRLPSAGNYAPSPQASTGVVQNIPESIDRAGKIMEALYNRDLQNPSIFTSLVGAEQSGLHPVSGLVDQDYPGVIERGLLGDKLFTVQHQTNIPPELRELLAQSEIGSCHMGLFPEIYRAWMTIDSDLYLWDFRDGSDLSFYDGLRESILGLALVPLKKNVFKSAIRHLLCLSTPSQIVILGFILSSGEPRSSPNPLRKATLELVPHPIFTLSSEQVTFPVIVASNSGRIFLGGSDGSVHEVEYQAGRGWLRDRCWKKDLTSSYFASYLSKFFTVSTPSPIMDIVIDNERNILFTLSQAGQIQAFDLGEDGTTFSRLAALSQETIINSVIITSKKTLEANTVRNILGIAVIEYGELNLVAITQEGTRLYFTCLPRPGLGMSLSTRPSTLKLAHIRLPPGYAPMSNMKRPSGSHIVYYGNGLCALATHSSHDSDVVWLIMPFLYPTQNYTEVSSIHVIPGSTIEMKEIKPRDVDPRVLEQPEILSQHLPWRREIVILTSHCVTVLRAAKPYELLRDLLISRQGPENIKGHFEMTPNKVHPLANSVLLATHPFLLQDNNVYEWATKALYLYGGGTEVSMRSVPGGHRVSFDLRSSSGFQDTGSGGDRNFGTDGLYQQQQQGRSANTSLLSPSSPTLGSPAMSSTFNYDPMSPGTPGSFASPTSPQGSTPYGGNQQQFPSNLQPQQLFAGTPMEQWPYSTRHDAIYTVVGRILGPFWNSRLIRPATVDGTKTTVIMPNLNADQVTYTISFLQSLHNFMLNNPSLYVTSYKLNINPGQMSATPDGRRLMNYELEKTSMASLKNFLSQALEVLGMWKILCDHQFHIVLKGVDERLQNATLRDLVVGGQNTISVIINALITKYLGDNAAVDSISLRLREVCPTLFKNEDAIGTKVAELLAKAKNTSDAAEKTSLLQDSLVLCEQMCGNGRVNIRNFCNQFADLGFPLGAVRLVSSAAKAADPNQLALLTVKSTASLDHAAIIAYNNRYEIYNIVFDMLQNYLDTSSHQSPLSGRKSDERLPSTKSAIYADETIRSILSSEDETFHIMLYNWLLERKLYDRLLEIQHQFLDSFLQRAAESVVSGKWPRSTINSNDTRVLDLLWRYHEMNQNHLAAAQILSKLAESSTSGLDFQHRFEYLARASICAKGIGRRGEILDTLEDKVEVAQIQKMIIEALSNRGSNLSGPSTSFDHAAGNEIKAIQDAVHRLNSQLFNITNLYADFAVPFKLNEAKLAIFHSAGHSDKTLIETLWADIIEAELSTSSRQSMESQMELIRRKLVTLGRKYIASPTYFPLEYLIEHLESMKPSEKVDEGWVFKTMLEVGVSFTELLTVYERLWRKVVQGQNSTSGAAETQLARVVMTMVTMFLNSEVEVRLHPPQMAELIEKCKDIIAAMIVEFSSKFEREAQDISALLNAVKDRLDRHR